MRIISSNILKFDSKIETNLYYGTKWVSSNKRVMIDTIFAAFVLWNKWNTVLNYVKHFSEKFLHKREMFHLFQNEKSIKSDTATLEIKMFEGNQRLNLAGRSAAFAI